MEIVLYSTKDSENVINKDIVLKHTFPIKMKEVVNVMSPEIVLAVNPSINLMVCNYAYIDGFLRYYFIRDIHILTNNNCKISLECDVLESFKSDILSSNAEYKRKIVTGDYPMINPITDVRSTNELHYSEVELSDYKNIVLSTIGSV